MKYTSKSCVLIVAVTLAALVLRLPYLAQRPMHGDEAVHAFKFGELLEENNYRYNPQEFHGPTLNYFTLIPAWLSSAESYSQLNEFMLRVVPVFFGVLLIFLLLLLVDGLGPWASVCAAVLAAVSPAFVFYSRYYIQETLLVCFTFGVIACGWRYTRSKKLLWALLAGIFLGLMHATKETCIIAFGSMLLALSLVLLTGRTQREAALDVFKGIKPLHLITAAGGALIVSVAFYSSFFTNFPGVVDSIRSYAVYFNRAADNELHIHPWHYYLRILTFTKYEGAPIWSEALIVLPALVGIILAVTKRTVIGVHLHLLRFIAFYTVIMGVIYSAIPYKTPWSMLGFLHGMILLAGVGAAAVVKRTSKSRVRVAVVILLLGGTGNLTWQAYMSSYRFHTDTRNPYVYAHPVEDVVIIAQEVETIARSQADGHAMHVQVICPGGDYWPLPWYLRSLTKVGYWERVDFEEPSAGIIIVKPEVEPDLIRKLYEIPPAGERELYVPLFENYMELRPKVELRGYVKKSLWDRYEQLRLH